MIERLLRDGELCTLASGARPDADPRDVIAQAAWSVLTEPGDSTAGALIAAFGAADALAAALPDRGATGAEESAMDTLGGAGAGRVLRDARARWRPRADLDAVRAALASAGRVGARLVLPGDAEWPSAFDDLGMHAPVMLWVRGDASVLTATTPVSIVGARAATSYGEFVTSELAGDLAAGGCTVVSGGAYGIDGSAHRAALGVGAPTIAFLAGGADRTYPAGNQAMFDRILQDGALASEVPCGTPPTRWRFLARNRLIAAAGRATVVVEAGHRSGSLNTAGHAASLGRPLGAVPGPITSAASTGCHRLLREFDAQCVTTAAEVRQLWEPAPAAESAPSLWTDPDETRLLDALSARSAAAPDVVARRCGLAIERVRALLGRLELDGVVRRVDSGWMKSAQTSR